MHYTLKIFPLALLVFALQSHLKAQSNEVYLQSDRNCYVSGDMAYIKVYHFNATGQTHFPATVYVDLVTPNGKFVAGEILPMANNLATGYMPIPDTLTTGTYICRVYTDFSKTQTKAVLGTKQIYVSNRFGKNEPMFDFTVSDFDKPLDNDSLPADLKCTVTLQSDTVALRNKVKCQIKFDSPFDEADSLFASISVIPVSKYEKVMATKNTSITQFQNKPFGYDSQMEQNNLPKGLKVSGRVTDKTSGTPVSNSLVFLSFPDTVLRLKYAITNEKGEFTFYLAHEFGYHEVYFTTFSYPALTPLYNTAIEFNPTFLSESNEPISNAEIVGYRQSPDTLNVIKSVIGKAYQVSSSEFSKQPLRDTFLFEHKYLTGPVNNIVNMDDYVELPDFIEISKEILPFVRYRKTDEGVQISVIDGPNNVIRTNPIVFVDGIPLINFEKLSSWGTDKIKRVETRCQPRVWGDVLFGNGIVLVYTRQGNFWSLVNNISNQVVPMQVYQKPIHFTFARYNQRQNYYLPDFRQTIYWNPNIAVTGQGTYELDFYASDETGAFEILFEGISKKGNTVICRKLFYVK